MTPASRLGSLGAQPGAQRQRLLMGRVGTGRKGVAGCSGGGGVAVWLRQGLQITPPPFTVTLWGNHSVTLRLRSLVSRTEGCRQDNGADTGAAASTLGLHEEVPPASPRQRGRRAAVCRWGNRRTAWKRAPEGCGWGQGWVPRGPTAGSRPVHGSRRPVPTLWEPSQDSTWLGPLGSTRERDLGISSFMPAHTMLGG